MNKISVTTGIIAIILFASCESKKKKTEITEKYSVTSPLVTDTSIAKEYVSQIQSVRNIEIHAQEKGYLQSINVDEGQFVRTGQLLFTIMPKLYEAEYQKAEAAEKGAEVEMQNTKILADKNIVSKNELAVAQAKLDETKADLALARIHLSFTRIRAPFEGTIDRIRFKPGSLVDEGSLLTSLSDNRSVYAYFNVGESEYLNFKSQANTGVKTSVDLILANGQSHKYKGTVETVESEFDNNTGNIAFRAKFPNPDLLLKHGETGKIRMVVPLHHALIIPQKATYELQDKIYVYVVDQNNTLKSRSITIKNTLPDLYVIDSGLSEGDKILLEGVQNVRDDDKIQCNYIDPKEVVSNLQLIKQK